MNQTTLKTILIALFFLAFTGMFFYFSTKDKYDFLDRAKFYGLKRINPKELSQAITGLELKEKNFWQINPRKISNYLSKRPLIRDIKIRTRILPKPHYEVYVLEEKPWAMYRKGIYNIESKLIIESEVAAKLYESQAVTRLYQDFAKQKLGLLQISSYSILDEKKLIAIRDISLYIEKYLTIINNLDGVISAQVDSESNLNIKSKNYTFILGALDDDLMKRASKLEQISYQASKLKDELAYIDLSLSTDG